MLVCLARPTSFSVCLHLLFTEFRESINGIQEILEGMTTKVNIDSEPSILIESKVVDELEPKTVDEPEPEVDEPESKVIDEPKPEREVEEPLIKTFVDLPIELPWRYCHFR